MTRLLIPTRRRTTNPTFTTNMNSDTVYIILISPSAIADRHLTSTTNIFSRPSFTSAPTGNTASGVHEVHRSPPKGGPIRPARSQRADRTAHRGDLVRQREVAGASASAACFASGPFFASRGGPQLLDDISSAAWPRGQAQKPARGHGKVVKREEPSIVQTSLEGNEHHFHAWRSPQADCITARLAALF